MIVNYLERDTERFAGGEFAASFQGFADLPATRLSILNAAPSLDALSSLPGNWLKALWGDRSGQFSIRINRQSRIYSNRRPGDSGPTDFVTATYR